MQLQWESYVRKLKESGTLSNALAVCDVSGSMSGLPMEVSCPARQRTFLVIAAALGLQCMVQRHVV